MLPTNKIRKHFMRKQSANSRRQLDGKRPLSFLFTYFARQTTPFLQRKTNYTLTLYDDTNEDFLATDKNLHIKVKDNLESEEVQ